MRKTLPEIKIEQFEGPYDLLIELARKQKMDLSDISLLKITESFLDSISKNNINADLQADFLVTAATLLLIKMRQLMPSLTEEEEEEITQLQSRLSEYELYRNISSEWFEKWDEDLLKEYVGPPRYKFEKKLPDIDSRDLNNCFDSLLGELKVPLFDAVKVRRSRISLKYCLQLFKKRLSKVKSINFQESFLSESSESGAMSFLAALELARRGEVELEQKKPYAPLTIKAS